MARTRISSKFNRCVKSVKKTVRARKGSNKESASIAICTKSVLHKRGRTLKSYTRKRLITQKKRRGGATVSGWKNYWDELESLSGNDRIPDMRRIAQQITSDGRLTDTPIDQDHIDNIFIFALKNESRELIQALHAKGISKDFMLLNIDSLLEEVGADDAAKLNPIRDFVVNLS